MLENQTTENNGEKFDRKKFLYARKKAWSGLNKLASTITPGDTEESIKEKHLDFFPEQSKSWHPPKVRFGHDTTCTFREKSTYLSPIEKGDLFFFDFGPIIDDHEADVGNTFCLGDESFTNPAQIVFTQCEELWLSDQLTGVALYEKAHEFAKQRGFELNPKMVGHRLGDFPHALHHKGSLGNFQSCPQNLLWILEIHLIDSQRNVGYFYEDLLGVEKS